MPMVTEVVAGPPSDDQGRTLLASYRLGVPYKVREDGGVGWVSGVALTPAEPTIYRLLASTFGI